MHRDCLSWRQLLIHSLHWIWSAKRERRFSIQSGQQHTLPQCYTQGFALWQQRTSVHPTSGCDLSLAHAGPWGKVWETITGKRRKLMETWKMMMSRRWDVSGPCRGSSSLGRLRAAGAFWGVHQGRISPARAHPTAPTRSRKGIEHLQDGRDGQVGWSGWAVRVRTSSALRAWQKVGSSITI